jgi:hypothetical protein
MKKTLLLASTDSSETPSSLRSTGISLATLARAKGYRCSIVIPDDVSKEKAELLRMLGAEIDAVRPRGIVDPKHVSQLGCSLYFIVSLLITCSPTRTVCQ